MSRNEREEGEGLFVRAVSLYLKAHSFSRVTYVREGMSACEDRMMEHTLQSDGTRIAECVVKAAEIVTEQTTKHTTGLWRE